MACILAVCIEMENSVINTVSHDCRNTFSKTWSWYFIQFQENVNINFTIKEEWRYWTEIILIGLLVKISRILSG